MTTIVFDSAAFRVQFPAFANPQCPADAQLNMWAVIASNYISTEDSCCFMLNGDNRVMALNMMVAHIGALFDKIKSGEQPGFVQSATVDKVTVTITPPPQTSQFMWWLSLTPYGQMLGGLLASVVAGGFYVGGLPERSAFRRVGGGFGGVIPNNC